MSNYFNRVGVIAIGVIAPLAIAHGLNTVSQDQPVNIVVLLVLEVIGFAFLMALLRPRLLLALVAAALYFPLMFIAIFSLGYFAGYYDLP